MEKPVMMDRNTVINELTQGRELANELKNQLNPINTPKEKCNSLLEKILSSYDNALALLALIGNGDSSHSQYSNILQLPISTQSSPISEGSDPDFKKNVSKKRKTLDKEVRVCIGKGVDDQINDGYNWRKYGQKDILGTNHPRAYYRCTHRITQGCLATKQVQRTDEGPSTFEVIFKGKHTCMQERLKQDKENFSLLKRKKETIIDEQSRFRVETQVLDFKQENGSSFSFPSTPIESEIVEAQLFSEPGTSYFPHTLSPATPESYFLLNDLGIGPSFPSSESEFGEVISNITPVANFPFGDLDFLIDQHDFDAYFLNHV